MTVSDQRSLWQTLRQRTNFLDRLTGGYVLLFGVAVALLGRDHTSWPLLVLVHALLLAAIVAIIRYWHDRRTGISGFVRQLYAPMLYPFFYSEMQVAVHWLSPVFRDAQLVALEQRIFGVDLNVWLIGWQKTWINEWMMFCYFSYYFLVALLALILFARRRFTQLQGFLSATTVAFVISYLGFVVYPVEGPRYFLASHFSAPLSGVVFSSLVHWVIKNGAIHGGCMPSSHVAVAWVVLIWAYRTQRRLAYVLTPIIVTLFAATVWGRFHYVSDVAVGWIVGVVGLWIADRWAVPTEMKSAAKSALVKAVPSPEAKTLGGYRR